MMFQVILKFNLASSQTSSCWIYDNKNKKSKGNFIVLSTHPEQIISKH